MLEGFREAISRIQELGGGLLGAAQSRPNHPAQNPSQPTDAGQTSFSEILNTASASPPAGQIRPGTGAFPYEQQITEAARKAGVDPALLRAVVRSESNYNPQAVSRAGAQGLTQLMPGTARMLGVRNPFNPVENLEGGARYLRQQLDANQGRVDLALASYNAGPAAVRRFGGVPPYPETKNYVARVLADYQRFSAAQED